MDWPANYQELHDLIFSVGDAYAGIVTNKPEIVLDLEYKKVSPGRLEIKQVREIPQVAGTNISPYLLNQPATFVTWQGLSRDHWIDHLFKSRWTLSTRTMQLTVSNLLEGLYTDVTVEYLDGTNIQTRSGPLSSFPEWSHGYNDNYTFDRWRMGTTSGGLPIEFELRTIQNLAPVSSRQPFTTLVQGGSLYLHTEGRHTQLHPEFAETPEDTLVEFTFQVESQGTNVIVRTSYWFGSTETYGNRPPLIRFVETRIEGLTTEPIVLRGFWSQTFSSAHAFGQETLLLEPRLEPGLPASQLAELNAADIAQLIMYRNATRTSEDGVVFVVHENPVLTIVGLNGASRIFNEAPPQQERREQEL